MRQTNWVAVFMVGFGWIVAVWLFFGVDWSALEGTLQAAYEAELAAAALAPPPNALERFVNATMPIILASSVVLMTIWAVWFGDW